MNFLTEILATGLTIFSWNSVKVLKFSILTMMGLQQNFQKLLQISLTFIVFFLTI